MSIWAIGDLHLSFGVSNKKMDIFGEGWIDHAEKIAANWRSSIGDDDLVLLPGDLSWATHLEDAEPDLEWLDALPGTKVLIRGNHDYWWSSLARMAKVMPPSIHLIQNNSFRWQEFSIGGARLWDSPEFCFCFDEEWEGKLEESQARKIWERELQRLELSLKTLDADAQVRIAMTHYPPLGNDLADSQASLLLEKYEVDICVFGHLHNIQKTQKTQKTPSLFGTKKGIRYILTSCDYLDFKPIQIA